MSLADALSRRPCQPQDFLPARWYILRYLLLFILALVWIGSGLVGLALPESSRTGGAACVVAGQSLRVTTLASSVADLMLGLALLTGRWTRSVLALMLTMVAIYTLAIGSLAPEHWLDPFGGLLKNLPIAAILIVVAGYGAASAMNAYAMLKFVHIVSATLLFGTGLGTAFFMWMTHRSGNIAAIATAARITVRADWLFTTPAVIVQPLSGIALMRLVGYPLSHILAAARDRAISSCRRLLAAGRRVATAHARPQRRVAARDGGRTAGCVPSLHALVVCARLAGFHRRARARSG